MKLHHDFYSFERGVKRVHISDHVEYNGALGHVVAVGRQYMTVLFYGVPAGHRTGRIKLDPFAASVSFPGTQHV